MVRGSLTCDALRNPTRYVECNLDARVGNPAGVIEGKHSKSRGISKGEYQRNNMKRLQFLHLFLIETETSYDDFQTASLRAFEPNRTVFGIAKELSATCSVTGFTNNGFVARDGLVKLRPDIYSIFADRLYCSAEFGAQKPAPEAFQSVLAQLGRHSDDILFIDDMEESV